MESFCFEEELECLKASYDSSEYNFYNSSNSFVLKFFLQNDASVTFEIPELYPQKPPLLSITSGELTKAEICVLEDEVRNLAKHSLGYPMIMDLVIKLQQLLNDYSIKNTTSGEQNKDSHLKERENYFTIILIDHMRQKRKYSNTLTCWASELNIFGCLLFYQRWIFLFLQGSKKYIKEFTIRHRTVIIDVDSNGKPCKEKMSKILYEGFSSGNFSDFLIKEMTSLEEMENYFTERNIINLFKDFIKPIIMKNKFSH